MSRHPTSPASRSCRRPVEAASPPPRGASSRWSRTSGSSTWTPRTCCTACAWPACPSAAGSWRRCRRTRTCASNCPVSLLCVGVTLARLRYGPFWVAATLVFLAAASGNMSTYFSYLRQLRTNPAATFSYDVTKVSLSAALFFGYITVLPLMVRPWDAGTEPWCLSSLCPPSDTPSARSGTLRCDTGARPPARPRLCRCMATHWQRFCQSRWRAWCRWMPCDGRLCW